MKVKANEPPRVFRVAPDSPVHIKDCAHIELDADEQITLVTPSGTEYDIARKNWGYYATPSLNARLKNFNLRAALIKNTKSGKYNIFLLEKGKETEFEAYLRSEALVVLYWLDSDEALAKLERCIAGMAS